MTRENFKVALLVTMWNEFEAVTRTIENAKAYLGDNVSAYAVCSDDGSGQKVNNADEFLLLPSMYQDVGFFKNGSYALTRNFSKLFTMAYDSGKEFDLIAAFCGDTVIQNPECLLYFYENMKKENTKLRCSSINGSYIHAAYDDPPNGRVASRFEMLGMADFSSYFFALDGEWARKHRAFSNIEITNEWASEQCLGDEFLKHIDGDFLSNACCFAVGEPGAADHPDILYHTTHTETGLHGVFDYGQRYEYLLKK